MPRFFLAAFDFLAAPRFAYARRVASLLAAAAARPEARRASLCV